MPDPLSMTLESVDAISTAPAASGGSGPAKLHVQAPLASPTSTVGGCASPMVAWRRVSQATALETPAPWPTPWAVQPVAPQKRRISPVRTNAKSRESSCPNRLPPNQSLGIRRLSSQQEPSSQQRDVSPVQALPPPTQVQVEPMSARGPCRDGGSRALQRHSDLSPRPTRQPVPTAVVWQPPQQCPGSVAHVRHPSPRRSPWQPTGAGSALAATGGGLPWPSGVCSGNGAGSGLVGITLSGGTSASPPSGCSTAACDAGTGVVPSAPVPATYVAAQML